MKKVGKKEYTAREWVALGGIFAMLTGFKIGKHCNLGADDVRLSRTHSETRKDGIWVLCTTLFFNPRGEINIVMDCVVEVRQTLNLTQKDRADPIQYEVDQISWKAAMDKTPVACGLWYPTKEQSYCEACPTDITGHHHPSRCPNCGCAMKVVDR